MNKLKKNLYKIFTLGIIGSLYLLLALNIIYPKSEYLYFENRNKTKKPELTKEELLNNNYFDQLELYFKDNFPRRESVLKLGTIINLNLVKRPVVNDLYIKDKVILPILEDLREAYKDDEIYNFADQYIDLSKEIENRGANFIYLGVPRHISIFKDEYPDYIETEEEILTDMEEKFFSKLSEGGVNSIKMRDFFEGRAYEYYNATDHHYSFYGAVESYRKLIDEINRIGNLNLVHEDLEIIKLDRPFKGSYSKKLFYQDKFDDEALIYKDDFSYTRKDNGEKVENRLFHLDDIRDGFYGYGIYMGGDHGFTEIDTARENLPNILIYGDSYTNPIETLLARNSNKLWSVDFRHFKDKDLLELVDELEPDFVICVRDNSKYLDPEDNGITR